MTKEEILVAIAKDYRDKYKIWHDVTEDPLYFYSLERYRKGLRSSLYIIGEQYQISRDEIDEAFDLVDTEFCKTQLSIDRPCS
jgi:hypothetical protein